MSGPENTTKDELRARVHWAAELRERIATAILPTATENYARYANQSGGWDENWRIAVAKDACDMADALIDELAARQAAELNGRAGS